MKVVISGRRWSDAFVASAIIALLCTAGLATSSANAADKALLDVYYEGGSSDSSTRAPILRDFRQLGVKWVRVGVDWGRLEAEQNSYAAAEVARLDELVNELRMTGVKVLLGVNYLPTWAQDRSFSGNPGTAYPIRTDALDDFGRLGEFLAAHFGDRVRDIECWNEPNLWTCLYPQRTATDDYFAARSYLRMLKAFYDGVQRGNPAVRVVAGATAPIGLNDRLRTSPQRFAQFLKNHGAGAYLDVYSHHPYTPGGSVHNAPDQPPNDPSTTVALYNLSTLLRLFPNKPFYLTEYGYNTHATAAFGGASVSQVQQAKYLRTAFSYVRRYRQVKLLLWLLDRDVMPEGFPADLGIYTGLREADGSRKLSWFVYAGGNRVSLVAPDRARRGSRITLRGRVTCASIGGVANRTITVQGRRLGTTRWYAQARVTTGADGRYVVRLPFTRAAQYRVRWSVVRASIVRTVRAR